MLSPLYGQLSPLRIPTKAARLISSDADVSAYILAVESADGQQLEAGVITAVESFVLGCKSDGIWTALKASCILAGARTLNGALVPLVGTAPTNNNFVSADYNRETGLIGNASTKYLNSNRANNSDPQNDAHWSVYISSLPTLTTQVQIGVDGTAFYSHIVTTASRTALHRMNGNNTSGPSRSLSGLGLYGASRDSATSFKYIAPGDTSPLTYSSSNSAQSSLNYYVLANNRNGSLHVPTNARVPFYSIGEAVDLAALSTRVSTLMTELAVAIP